MKFSFFLIVLLFSLKNCDFDFQKKLISYANESNIADNYTEKIRESLQHLVFESILFALDGALNKTIQNDNKQEQNELEECRNIFQIFNLTNQTEKEKNISTYYFLLLYYDGSKSKNDLTQYEDCVKSQSFNLHNYEVTSEERKKFIEDSTYFVFKIIENNNKSIHDFTFKDNEFLFGFCMKKGCSENAIKKLFLELNNNIISFFENLEENNLEIYDIKAKKENNKYWLIPLIILHLIILLNPLHFFLKCFRLNHRKNLIKLIDCFDCNINYKEILGKEQNDDSSNLNLIKGIRGITLISITISCCFFYIYHLPSKVINEIYIKDLLKNSAFPLIYHGARFGKKILYALSGLELTCKMIHYLDDSLKKNFINKGKNKKNKFLSINDEEEIGEEEEMEKDNEFKIGLDNIENNNLINEEEDEDEEEKNYLNKNYMQILTKKEGSFLEKEEKENVINDQKIKDNLTKDLIESESHAFKKDNTPNENYYEKTRKNLGKKVLINWFFRQIYKYIIFILVIIYYKYGTIYMFSTSENIRPIWILYFNEISKKFTPLQLLANLFLFSPFSYKTFNWVDPFDLVYNEITFFIIGSILIYFSYKRCWRLDIIILISFFLLFVFKIILGIFVIIPIDYYPTMFYQYDGNNQKLRSYLSSNQFMNLNVFLLGMFFGEIHYCIYYEEKKDENKKYLKLAWNLMTFFKRLFLKQTFMQSILIQFFLLFLIAAYIAIVYIYEILINKFMDSENSEYYTFFANKTFNIIALIDSDIAVVVLLFILLVLFFHRDKIFSKFLEHKYWRILSIPYWCNILFLHIMASYTFYFREKRIKLIIYSAIFRSFQVILLLVLISDFLFVFVEMPLKNISKKFLAII